MCLPRTPRVSEDKIQDSWIRINSNVFREKFSILLSSFSSIIHLSTPDPHWGCSYFTYVSGQVGLCLSGLEERSGVQGFRHEIRHIVFLGMLFDSAEVKPSLCLKTLERIRLRAWRGQGRNLDLGETP